MKPLHQRHIMLAQPRQSHPQLQKQLEAAGAQVTMVPTIGITPIPCHLPSHQDDRPIYAIVTSQHAVESFARIDQHNMHIIAVGPSTAKALQQAGVNVETIAPPPYGSNALLRLPMWPIQEPHHLWIFCGEDCGQQLQQSLLAINMTPQMIACYQRQTAKQKLGDFWPPHTPLDAIVCLSHDNLDALITIANESLKPLLNTPITTVNPVMDDAAQAAGWATTIPLNDPTHDTVTNTLSSFFHRH